MTRTHRAIFSIQGMSCASCANAVRQAAPPSTIELKVEPLSGRAIALVPDAQAADDLARAITEAGFEAELLELIPVQAGPVYEVHASIEGMTCSACATTIRQAVADLGFCRQASIDPLTGQATFTLTSADDEPTLRETIENTGYDYTLLSLSECKDTQPDTKTRTVTLEIQGMFCEACPSNVLEILASYGDAVEVEKTPTLVRPTVRFTYVPAPPKFGIRAILSEIREQAGLECVAVHPASPEEIAHAAREREKRDILRRFKVTAVLAVVPAVLMAMPMAMMSLPAKLVLGVLATPVYCWSALIFHKHAFNAAQFRGPLNFGSMNLLMSLGTSISYWASIVLLVVDPEADSYFDSVIFLTLFLLAGRYLDVYSKAKTTTAVTSLQNLWPDTAQVKEDGDFVVVPTWQVDVGDYCKVAAGSKSGVDGTVASGTSEFDEATLTGEARPCPKAKGDAVYGGTLNVGTEAVTLKVSAVEQGTLLHGIVEAVRQGQITRASIEGAADQVTAMFVPVVIYLALLTWAVWYWLSRDFIASMEFAISVFVVACPCGVGLAAPTALYVGGGVAAQNGIIARGGGEAFEQGAGVDVVCFDKTGTLTTSNAKVTDVWFGQLVELVDKRELVQLAARIENDSSHPLAEAVKAHATGAVMSSRVDGVKLVPGRGLRASVVAGPYEGKTAYLGNVRLATEHNVTVPAELETKLGEWKQAGNSVMVLFIEGTILMAMAARDEVRLEAPATVAALKQLGIECWLISGDNLETASVVARDVGIENVIAEVLPQEKADRIKQLQEKPRGGRRSVVAMVGDGVNDAPAIALSDVGIAIGGGADITLNTAKFILVNSDLKGVAITLDLAKAVMHKVWLNFAWAALYNVLAVPFAAGVFSHWGLRLNPVFASLAMCLSSLSVMANSLMLKRYKYI